MVAGGYPVQVGDRDPSEDGDISKVETKNSGDAAEGGNEPPPIRCRVHLSNAHALPLQTPCVSFWHVATARHASVPGR